ncbi:uncharacterized protein LOC143298664 [Babylonia areolata]|uniref:uncharacterized protein LOC143298664 n=1 Tax=Babylonia areolata TaxID=304850 RepID=UPI003FD576A9
MTQFEEKGHAHAQTQDINPASHARADSTTTRFCTKAIHTTGIQTDCVIRLSSTPHYPSTYLSLCEMLVMLMPLHPSHHPHSPTQSSTPHYPSTYLSLCEMLVMLMPLHPSHHPHSPTQSSTPHYPSTYLTLAPVCLPAGVQGDCPSGWQSWGENCYLLQRTAVEQAAAVAFCGLYNASLVSVMSTLEYVRTLLFFLSTVVMSASQSSYGQSAKYWTGLHRVGQTYRWSDGTLFSLWTSVHIIRGQSGQQCSSWSPDTGSIEFESCDQLNRPLCKRPASLSYIDRCDEADGWQDINGACFKLFNVTSSWSDAHLQCRRHSGDLYVPGTSSFVINRLLSCRISVTHVWLGVSDTTHPGTLMMVNGSQSHVQLDMGDKSIIEPGNTCVEVVTTITDALRYQTDVCHHEKQFICQKPYGTCPGGWEEHSGRCYQVLTSSLGGTTWFLAKRHCDNQGSEMLIVNSMDEHMFIAQRLIYYKLPSVWLGFSDEDVPDVLHWVDGNAANGSGVFNVWAPGFPQPVANRMDCGLMQVGTDNGTWSHEYCYNRQSFICELHVGRTLSSPPSVYADKVCDDGWKLFRDQCFLFSNQQVTWEAASLKCDLDGAHLAVIPDPYLLSFLSGQRCHVTCGVVWVLCESHVMVLCAVSLPDTGVAWIGAKLDSNGNKYYWTDNTELQFTNYVPGEPDGGSEDLGCLEMVSTGSFNYPGGWVDQNCSLLQDFICQKPADAWSLRCDAGWRLNSKDDLCYLVVAGPGKTWLEAGYDCQRRGGHLLSLSGPLEQLHVEAMLGTGHPSTQSFWIGASDSTQEGGWEWSDGSPFRYLHWHPGQPDDGQSTEDCAEVVLSWNYQWNDRNCDDSLPYICKKPARPPATSATPTIPTVVPATTCDYGPLISGQYSVQSEFAFTSSSDLDSNHTASNIRLLPDNPRAWRPSRDAVGEWVGVTFYQTMAVTGLSLKGEPLSFSFVTSFTVQYQYTAHSPWYWVTSSLSTDGQPQPAVYVARVQMFDGPTTDDTSNTVLFDVVIYAQSVRVFPQKWGQHIAVQLELTGCVEESCSMDYAVSGPLVVMEGGFRASSMSDFLHSPSSARLRPLSQNTAPSCWRAKESSLDPAHPPWVEVDLGGIKLLRGVTVMGNPDADEYVTSFQLQYRLNDGSNSYVAYQEPYGVPMLSGLPGALWSDLTNSYVDYQEPCVTALLQSVISAQHVRLVALAFHGHVALRFDLLVCSQATCKDIALLSGQHNVSNSAFSASSSRDPQHGPFHARLGARAFGDIGGAWVAKFNDDHQYIQVDLGVKIQVWAVSTQGSEELQQWVRAYTLAFSRDGHVFSSYSADGSNPKVFDGNFDASTVRKHYLSKATVARFVQLWPSDFNDGIALRWEVYGCPGPESGDYLGCFLDEEDHRDLPFEPLIDVNAHVGPVSCRYHCFDKGYAFAGLQRGIACYCGNSYGKFGSSMKSCTTQCLPPFEMEICGGHLANSVFSTGLVPRNVFCDAGWASYGDSCYEVLEDERTWFDAHEMCRQLGAELVSIDSQLENDYVFSIVAGLAVQGGVWLGLNDIQESYFYQWNDGSEVTFTNWDVGMPVSSPSQEQHCVALNNQTGGWRTVFCEERMMYACKTPKKPSPIPHLPPLVAGCEGVEWRAFKWSCYMVVQERQTWMSAQRVCSAKGGTLVRINDRYEQAFVSSLVGSRSGYVWTDVSDTHSPSTFAFSDRSPVTFTVWGTQPASAQISENFDTDADGRCELRQHRMLLNSSPHHQADDPARYRPLRASETSNKIDGQAAPSHLLDSGHTQMGNVIAINETWLKTSGDESKCADLVPPGYKLRTFPRAARGGGLAVLYRDHLPVTVTSTFPFTLTSCDLIQFTLTAPQHVHFCLYRPPPSKQNNLLNSTFLTGLPDLLEYCNLLCGTSVVVSDFNVHYDVAADPLTSKVLDILSRFDFTQGVQEATYYRSGHILDWVLHREADQLVHSCRVSHMRQPVYRTVWDIKAIDRDSFKADIQDMLDDLGPDLSAQQLDDAVSDILRDAKKERRRASNKGCIGVGGGRVAGLWYTLPCASLYPALCEKARGGVTPPPTQPLVPPGARCPPQWFPSRYSCFQAGMPHKVGLVQGEGVAWVNTQTDGQKLTWDEARADCRTKGADLASFHSHQDLEDVWRQRMAGNDGNFWIGLRYSDQDKSLEWSDGSGVNFVQWAPGETDTLQGLKNCGELLVDTGNMAHQFCSAFRNWVCSIPRGGVLKPLTTVTAPTAGAPGSCYPLDNRWKSYNGACYLVQTGEGEGALTWREANAWCQQAHTALLSITSPREQLFIHSLIQNVSSDSVWIGLNKLDIGHGFQWSDGSPTSFENWNVNEPNNFGHLEYCVNMLTKNGKWQDDVCTRKKGFICKQASYVTPAPPASTTPVYGYCPAGYSPFKHKCLRVYGGSEGERLLSWVDARNDCRRRGPGHDLASIEDLEENLKIVTLLGTNQLSAWIGLKRLDDGTFTWTDSSEVTFTNWDDGEPSGGTQSCVYMKGTSSSAGEWSDAPCFQQANYVCQAPKNQKDFPPDVPTPCDVNLGFYPYKAGCYQYMSLGQNYSSAMESCHQFGANLVTIDDAFSQAFVRLFVAHSLGLHFESDIVQTVWIGLNDMQHKGVYGWTLGWPVTFTNWAPGEPSRGPGEGCVSMRPDGLWVDDNCSREISYICAIINENYTTFTPQPPRGQCLGADWVPHGDFCYLLRGHDTRTFYEAQLRCQEQQAHLTSVHDNGTARFLVSMMVPQTEFHFWVGLYGSAGAGFTWVDRSAVDFTNWATSEPSGMNPEGVAENCVGLDPRTRQWSDLDCDLRLGYVCRKRQEVDDSAKTRPPVIGPSHSPPTAVPQKSPGTIQPAVTSPSHGPTFASTPSSTPSSGPHQSVRTSPGVVIHHPSSSTSGAFPVPTKQAATGSSPALSSGAVAGIVMAVLVLAAAGAVGTLIFVRRRQRHQRSAENSNFSNPMFAFESRGSSQRRDGRHEEVSLGVMGNRNPEVGEDLDS